MRKRIILIALAAALALVLALLLLRRPGGQDFVLRRSDVEYSILANCTVSFPEPYAMKAKAAGDVIAVPAAEGQAMKAGELLVQLDDFRERQDLAIARSDYESVKLKMVNAREELYPRLREELNDAAARLQEARANAERLDSLFQAGALAKVEWERARTALEAAQARFNGVKLQVDSYSRSGAAAELANQLNALDARVELARRAVADKRLVAPYDGTVVRLDVKPGEAVAAGRQLAIVLERTPWVLEADVDQKELPFLENGLPCAVRFDAFPGETVAAQVSLVCSVIDLDKGTCGLKIRVAEERSFIRHGMTGSVEIRGKKIPGLNAGVLALPARYLIREGGGGFVLLRRGGKLEKTAVQAAAIGEEWLSVKGLAEGARVALPE